MVSAGRTVTAQVALLLLGLHCYCSGRTVTAQVALLLLSVGVQCASVGVQWHPWLANHSASDQAHTDLLPGHIGIGIHHVAVHGAQPKGEHQRSLANVNPTRMRIFLVVQGHHLARPRPQASPKQSLRRWSVLPVHGFAFSHSPLLNLAHHHASEALLAISERVVVMKALVLDVEHNHDPMPGCMVAGAPAQDLGKDW